MRHSGSLGPAFASWILTVRIHVKPAFALTLNGRFLTCLSRPLGALVTFSSAWRPTQTAHLSVSPRRGKCYDPRRAVFHRRLHPSWRPGFDGSRLRYTSRTVTQRQAAVKLNGVFAFRWEILDCAPVRQFHRLPGGDSGALVGPSCKPPIKRQGITLP